MLCPGSEYCRCFKASTFLLFILTYIVYSNHCIISHSSFAVLIMTYRSHGPLLPTDIGGRAVSNTLYWYGSDYRNRSSSQPRDSITYVYALRFTFSIPMSVLKRRRLQTESSVAQPQLVEPLLPNSIPKKTLFCRLIDYISTNEPFG